MVVMGLCVSGGVHSKVEEFYRDLIEPPLCMSINRQSRADIEISQLGRLGWTSVFVECFTATQLRDYSALFLVLTSL